MSPRLRHPETNEPIRSLNEFEGIAREMAGLDYYKSDDPGRPFEGTSQESKDQTPVELSVPEAPAEVPAVVTKQSLIAKWDIIKAQAEARKKESDSRIRDREDPWGSLGGGHNTYHQLGKLPVSGEIQEQTVRGVGGRLETKLTHTGTGKVIRVPVNDRAHARSVEDAKRRLENGEGTRPRARKRV